jgi:hypothetical protein
MLTFGKLTKLLIKKDAFLIKENKLGRVINCLCIECKDAKVLITNRNSCYTRLMMYQLHRCLTLSSGELHTRYRIGHVNGMRDYV